MKLLDNIPIETTESAEINMSPLIDMVFLLLIFFILAPVFVEETGVEVQRPRAVSAARLDRSSILLAVTQDGRVMHGGREVGVNGVQGLVSRLLAAQELPVIVVADESSRTGTLVEVIDQCRLGGAKQVNVAARRPQ